MRKTIIGVVVVAGGVLAGFLAFLSGQAPNPALFLPAPKETAVEIHLEHTTQVVEALASLAQHLGLTSKEASLKKIAPALGQSAWLVNLAEDDSHYDLWCVAEISDPEQALEVASLLAELLGEGALDMVPLEGDLPEGMSPLFRLQERSGDLCAALYRTQGRAVIVGAPSVKDLAGMIVEKERPVKRETQGPDWLRSTISAAYLKKTSCVALSGDQSVKLELGLQTNDDKVALSSWSNGASLFLSPKERQSLASMSPVSLYGGGSLVGLLAWTGIENRTYPSWEEVLAATSSEKLFALETVRQLMNSVDMTWDDLMHIFNRRTSVVLGTEAGGLLGNFPGGYILWEGVSSDLGRRLTGVVQTLSLPFGVAHLDVDGWDGGLSLRLPVTAVMAYGPSGLLMGILNPDGLNRSPQIPSSIEKAVVQEGPFALAVDIQELSRALDVYEKMAGLAGLPVGDLKMNTLQEKLSSWDRLVLRYEDLDRSTWILYRRR
ncbi:MAG: hypothetical protein CSA35_02685 [Dethiosulfovibrio peptidovorans]|nr:MAG: hypothetical protein CSA35_02685 [Dethiosulfovibrio peptidovorans]